MSFPSGLRPRSFGQYQAAWLCFKDPTPETPTKVGTLELVNNNPTIPTSETYDAYLSPGTVFQTGPGAANEDGAGGFMVIDACPTGRSLH